MKKTTTILILSLLMIATTSSAQWTVNTSPVSGYFTAFDIHFNNNNDGFVGGQTALIGGSGKISKTTNGGSSWTDVFSVANTVVKDIFFVNSNLGFAVGGGGLIAKTTDGGDNWTSQIYTNPNTFNFEAFESIYFIDQNTGYIAGGFNEMWVMKTTDGGSNWSALTMPAYFQRLKSIYFTNANTGYIAGGDNTGGGTGEIYKTIDGGTSWTQLNSNVSNKYYNDIHFIDANNGVIGCNDGTLLKTTNAGLSWTTITNPAGNDAITEFGFANSTLGYAAIITGKIIKTIDGGNSWSIDATVSPTMSALYSITIPSTTYGASVGFFGQYAEINESTNVSNISGNTNYSIYPNPTTGDIFINLTEVKAQLKATLTNSLGQVVFSEKFESKNTIKLNIKTPKGIYFLQLETENGDIITKKIIKR